MARRANRLRGHFGRRPDPTERRREQAMRDWYGADRATAETAYLRGPPQPVGSVVDRVLAQIRMAEIALLDRLAGAWPDFVGPDVAGQARPVSVRDDELMVEVDSPAWLYMLRGHLPVIVQRVTEFTGGKVTKVRLIPKGRYSPREGERRNG